MSTKHQIHIVMEGGIIQDIENIPRDVEVIVRDYDVIDEDNYEEDDWGDRYIENVWG